MRRILAAVLACVVVTAGCGEPPAVRTYTAPKPTPPTRLLAALVPTEDGAWFFEAVGRYQTVSEHTEKFWDFLETVEFDSRSGEPIWTLPEGWRERPPRLGEMQYSTLIVPTPDFPLEISVSQFQRPRGVDEETFLLKNVNAWRQQLSADPVDTVAELEKVVTRRTVDDYEALCVDLSGRQAPRGGAAPPRRDPAPTPEFAAPDGWEEMPLAPFSIATYGLPAPDGLPAGAGKPTVTISEVGGGLMANSSRWFGQVGMPPAGSLKELESKMTPIEGAQGNARLLEMIRNQEPGTKVVVVAVLQHAGADWYVKYSGPHAVWQQQRAAFEELVKSIDFSGDNG